MTLKALNYVSTMRTNIGLIGRSKKCPNSDWFDARAQTVHNLEQGNLIYPPTMLRLGLRPDMSLDERKKVLGLQPAAIERTENEIEFLDMLRKNGEQSRQSQWVFRCGAEASFMAEKQWFPFFVTLTVDPSRVDDPALMWKEGREWRKYIRQLSKVVTQELGLPPAHKSNVPESEYVRYVGVLEHGKSLEHHHMHALVWMRAIPSSWKKCPNRAIRNPEMRNRRRCEQLERFWKFAAPGRKPAMYFRHTGDVWSKMGFVVPVDNKTKRPMKVHPPATAGVYLAKYMTKEAKAWTHRVKATRNVGLQQLKERIWKMNAQRVEALTWRPRNHDLSISLTTIHSVPLGLIRLLAKQILFCKKWAGRQLDFMSLMQESSDPLKTMLESVRDGQRPHRMDLRQRYDWVTAHLPEPDGYSDRRLRAAHSALIDLFPVHDWKGVTHIGGNDIGFTQQL